MIQAINGKNGGGEQVMPRLWLKRRFDPVSETSRVRIACAAVVAALLIVICGSVHASAETPALNTSGPSTFRGEIAKGLKIEMRLYQDGSNLSGTYSYEAFGRDIQVKGTVNERGEFSLQEFVKGKVTGNFEGKFVTMDRAEGRWFKKSPQETGRSFYVTRTGTPLAATQVLPTQKTNNADHQASPAAKEARTAPKAEVVRTAQKVEAAQATPKAEAVRTAPKAEAVKIAAAAEARPEPVSSAKQQSLPVAKEVPLPQQETKTEAKVQPVERAVASQQMPLKIESAQSTPREEPALRPVVAQELPKISEEAEAQSAEKPRIEGRTVAPIKKKNSPWMSFLSIFNMKVAGGVGGILLLGGGLAWLAVVAGGAAAFRDNSALFRQAHAMGLSFLPGIFLLALGVGAVLAVFVE
jgi:hypothetical protein